MPVGTRGAVKGVTVDAAATRSAPRSSSPTRTTCTCGRATISIARAGGLHAFMGVAAADPHRLGRLSGLQPRRRGARSERRRRHLSVASRRPRAHADARVGRRHPGASRIGRRDDVRRVSELARDARATPTPRCARTLRWARRGRDRFLALAAGAVAGRAAADARAGAVRHHSGRHLSRTCATRASPARWRSGSTPTRSAGLSVGEPVEVMYDVVGPHRRRSCRTTGPRYLMGTGMPDDLVESVARGIDLFDCVLPTRNARNGQLFTRRRAHLDQERPVRRGRPAARPGLPVPDLPAPFPGLSAPSFHGRRDERGHPQHVAQSALLP